MKLSINWQDCNPSVLSQDLNQFAAYQEELPRSLSGTGQIEIIKNTESP
jgi:hypothetical protein